MSMEVTRLDGTRRILVVVHGPFLAQEFVSILQDLRSSGAWSYGVVLDLRRMTGAPRIAELRPFMELARLTGPAEEPRGPVAIVAAGPVVYGMACAYAAMSQPRGRVEVFHHREEAEAWLDTRSG